MNPSIAYSKEELDIVKSGALKGFGPQEIAGWLPNRSVYSVSMKIHRMRQYGDLPKAPERTPRIPKKPRSEKLVEAIRSCLSCGSDFRSQWAGNRICPVCKPRQRDYSPAYQAVVRV